jgi:hypothetical protein
MAFTLRSGLKCGTCESDYTECKGINEQGNKAIFGSKKCRDAFNQCVALRKKAQQRNEKKMAIRSKK